MQNFFKSKQNNKVKEDNLSTLENSSNKKIEDLTDVEKNAYILGDIPSLQKNVWQVLNQ